MNHASSAALPSPPAGGSAPRAPQDFNARLVRFDALGALDAVGLAISPASVLVEFWPAPSAPARTPWQARLLAAGTPGEVDAHPAWSSRAPGQLAPGSLSVGAGVKRYSLPRSILIPGLVNAHTHLDLTHLGPRPYDPSGGFERWVNMIRAGRLSDEQAIAQSVHDGLAKSWRGGVVAVGDIAGAVGGRASLAGARARLDSAMHGVSFVEFFAIGVHQTKALEHLQSVLEQAPAGGGVGVQPHAPYSVSPEAYRIAADLARARSWLLCTHLAESDDERELITLGTGRLRRMLEQIGAWTPELGEVFGQGRSPVAHLGVDLLRQLGLVVHLNQASDADIELLARAGATVVYCPRASEYFGHDAAFGAHRYRDMLQAGVPVVLGTDSIVNLDTPDRISPLDDARRLFQRDGVRPARVLGMCTNHAARALGLPGEAFTLSDQVRLAGLVAVEVIEAGENPPEGLHREALGGVVLGSGPGRPELLFGGTFFG